MRLVGGPGFEKIRVATLYMVFSVTYYLKLHNAISIYYISHILTTNVKSVVWTLKKINNLT